MTPEAARPGRSDYLTSELLLVAQDLLSAADVRLHTSRTRKANGGVRCSVVYLSRSNTPASEPYARAILQQLQTNSMCLHVCLGDRELEHIIHTSHNKLQAGLMEVVRIKWSNAFLVWYQSKPSNSVLLDCWSYSLLLLNRHYMS